MLQDNPSTIGLGEFICWSSSGDKEYNETFTEHENEGNRWISDRCADNIFFTINRSPKILKKINNVSKIQTRQDDFFQIFITRPRATTLDLIRTWCEPPSADTFWFLFRKLSVLQEIVSYKKVAAMSHLCRWIFWKFLDPYFCCKS